MSMIAIYCILKVEGTFEKQLHRHNFQPQWKFWTIKIMIAVSFWVKIVMAIVRRWQHFTEDQVNLIDATLRIIVMLVVAGLNLKAWFPCAAWYDTVKRNDARDVDNKVAKVALLQVPQSTVDLVRTITNLSEDEARDLNKVKASIDNKDEKELVLMLHKSRKFFLSHFDEHEHLCDYEFRRKQLFERVKSMYPHQDQEQEEEETKDKKRRRATRA